MFFNKIVYSKLLIEAKYAPDHDTPTIVVATKESNGYAVFVDGYDCGTVIIEYFFLCNARDKAIERAVAFTLKDLERINE